MLINIIMIFIFVLVIFFFTITIIKNLEIIKKVFGNIKNIIQKQKVFLLKNFSVFKKWIAGYFGNDNLLLVPHSFEKDSTYKTYGQRLRKSYKHKEVRNIAITGGTASGKRSFIKTYEKKHTLPFCKYLHISFSDFQVDDKDTFTQETVAWYLVEQILPYAHDNDLPKSNYKTIPKTSSKVWLLMIVAFFFGIQIYRIFEQKDILFFGKDIQRTKWILLSCSVTLSSICLFLFCCIINFFRIFFKYFRRMRLDSAKVEISGIGAEAHLQEQEDFDSNIQQLIYALKKMRRRISYTLVIEDIDLFEIQKRIQILYQLKSLNRKLNNHILSYKFFRIDLRKPIRFIYVYKNELPEKIKDDIFQETISISGKLTIDNLTNTLERILEEELRKGLYKNVTPFGKMFHFDVGYISHVGKMIINQRIFNQIIKNYLSAWKDFTDKLGDYEPVADDPMRLFSFVLYEYFFPDDKKLFKYRESIALKARCENDLISITDEEKRKLLLYLIKDCPESYRVTNLCMRFVNFNPALLDRHLNDFEKAIQEENYELALICIDRVICCKPESGEYYNNRAHVLEMLGKTEQAMEDMERARRLMLYNNS